MSNSNQLYSNLVDEFMASSKKQFISMKSFAEKAIFQVKIDEKLYWLPDDESNSIAIIIKHLAGNMRSRWTNIFTEDGEKPDRNRPFEFDRSYKPTRVELLELWEKGWNYLFTSLNSINTQNINEKIYIRKEEHSVMDAILRQVNHYSLHIGQIVFLAKHIQWDTWRPLTIPRDKEIFDFKDI